eukprot:m.157934 g.157934  ORF g.157934 m.157934 type:complete len:161 (+) comp15168_c4_seq21:652-1134(+)
MLLSPRINYVLTHPARRGQCCCCCCRRGCCCGDGARDHHCPAARASSPSTRPARGRNGARLSRTCESSALTFSLALTRQARMADLATPTQSEPPASLFDELQGESPLFAATPKHFCLPSTPSPTPGSVAEDTHGRVVALEAELATAKEQVRVVWCRVTQR